jgi:PAS domain S-box-containing protein
MRNQAIPGSAKTESLSSSALEAAQQVMDDLPDAILLLDRNWRITYANSTARRMTRIDLQDVHGDTPWESHPLLGTSIWKSFPGTVYEGSPYIEHCYRAMNERIAGDFETFYPEPLNAWLHIVFRPSRDGIILFFRDVTVAADRLREQYAAIERQRRELEAIYRGSPIGLALFEPKQLRLVRINDRQSEILGMRAEEALGKTVEELTPGLTEVHRIVRQAAQGEQMLNVEIEGELPARPGEHRYWNGSYSPIFAEDGSVQAIACATIETTQQKRAELALLQAEKLAAVGRMASSIAHEINNPLESVINLIYLARGHAILPEVKSLLQTADEELRRVSIIATQTLRFHRQSTKKQAVRCSELFSTVLSIYEGRLTNSQVTVEQRLCSQPIVCFEADMRQVLANLVGNAIDAMPAGGRLLVRGREAVDYRTGRPGFVLTVADTGSGIDAETRARMFEPFFSTKGFAGTGLGLWISAEIVQRHQGRLRVRSSQREGHRGTVISLFLPAEMG